MVLLGDSYSSGEGAGDVMQPQNQIVFDLENGRCHRSSHAWGSVLARTLRFTLSTGGAFRSDFRACSGAETTHILNGGWPKDRDAAQLDSRNQNDVWLVALTTGGNDSEVQFGPTVESCLGPNADCEQRLDAIAWRIPELLGPTFSEMYERLTETYPNALILHIAYPNLLPSGDAAFDESVVSTCQWISRKERLSSRLVIAAFESTIKEASDAFRTRTGKPVYAVSSRDAVQGHEWCSDEDSNNWHIHGITFDSAPKEVGVLQQSAHPTVEGQLDIERYVEPTVRALAKIPSTIAVNQSAPGTANLSWQLSSAAGVGRDDGVKLVGAEFAAAATARDGTVIEGVVDPKTRTATFTGLKDATTYRFTVRPISAAGLGPESNGVEIETGVSPPTTSAEPEPLATLQLRVSWTGWWPVLSTQGATSADHLLSESPPWSIWSPGVWCAGSRFDTPPPGDIVPLSDGLNGQSYCSFGFVDEADLLSVSLKADGYRQCADATFSLCRGPWTSFTLECGFWEIEVIDGRLVFPDDMLTRIHNAATAPPGSAALFRESCLARVNQKSISETETNE